MNERSFETINFSVLFFTYAQSCGYKFIRAIIGGFAYFLAFITNACEKRKRIRNAGYPCRSNDHPWPDDQMVIFTCR